MDKIIGVLILVFVSSSASDLEEPCSVTPDDTQPDNCIISVRCLDIVSTDISARIKATICFREKPNNYKIIFEANKIKKDKLQNIDAIDDILLDKVKSITIIESETTEVLNKILNKMTAAEKIILSGNSISEFNLNTRDTLKYIDASNNVITKLICPSDDRYNKLQSINLSNNNITDIPGSCFKYFDELRELNLSHNNINKMDDLAFQGLEKLERLSLGNNYLQQIDEIFLRLGNILELSLAYNNINEIFPNGLKAMTKLQKLDLKGNQLSILEENIFKTLKYMKILDLSENKLTTIPLLDNNISLEELYLQNNIIYNIPIGRFGHNKINKLYLKNNEISGALDKDAFEGLLISEIDLSSNNISQLGPKCFSSMKSLKKVSLNNNRLDKVSETAFQDLGLSELDLSYNELKNIQFQKNDLPDLKSLKVSHNKLSSLEFGFKNLELLDMSYNNIALFDFPKFDFTKLEKIFLKNNPLDGQMKETDLVQLEKVTEMDISYTKIKGFKPNAFKKMKNLKKLISHHCEIKEIQNAFDDVHSLEELDLSYNHLTAEVELNINTLKMLNLSHNEIVKATINNCNKLETLSLINNNVNSIDLSSLSDLKNIYLSDNPNLPIKANELDNIKLIENAILNNISTISFQNAINVNIKHLELSNCNIQNIDSVYLNNIKSLETLVLSHNQIKNISPNSFRDVSLTALDLSYNDIINVEPNTFENNNGIKSLNLAHNGLQYLHIKSLNGLTGLNSLDVSYNKLDSFEISRVNNLPSLKKIYIDNNQLTSMQFSDFSYTDLELMSIGDNKIPCTDIKYALNDTTNTKLKITTKEFSSDYNETKGIKCSSYDSKDNITAIEILEYLKNILNYVSGKVNSKNDEGLLNNILNLNKILNKNKKETLPLGTDLKKILDEFNSFKNVRQDIDIKLEQILPLLNETIKNLKKWDGLNKSKNVLQGLQDIDELINIVPALNETIAKINSSFVYYKNQNETLSQISDLKKYMDELNNPENVRQDIDKLIKFLPVLNETISKINSSYVYYKNQNETLSQISDIKKYMDELDNPQNVRQDIDKLIKFLPVLNETISKINSSFVYNASALTNGSVKYLLNFRLLAFIVLFLYYVK